GTTEQEGVVLSGVVAPRHAVAGPEATSLGVEADVLEAEVVVDLDPALADAEEGLRVGPGGVRALEALDGQVTARDAVADGEEHLRPLAAVVRRILPAQVLVVGDDRRVHRGAAAALGHHVAGTETHTHRSAEVAAVAKLPGATRVGAAHRARRRRT